MKVSVVGCWLSFCFYKLFGPHRYLASTFQGLRRSKISIPENEAVWVEYLFWPAHLGLTLRHRQLKLHVWYGPVDQTSTLEGPLFLAWSKEEPTITKNGDLVYLRGKLFGRAILLSTRGPHSWGGPIPSILANPKRTSPLSLSSTFSLRNCPAC